MKKSEREQKAEQIARTVRSIVQAEEISRRKKTERLRKLRQMADSGADSERKKPADGGDTRA